MAMPQPQTPKDLIELALKMSSVLGVGQTASAEDTNDAFNILNLMLDTWQTNRLMVYSLTTTSFTATGAQSYTLGAGGDINIPWVQRLDSAYFNQLQGSAQPVSFPLQIIRAQEDYNRISVKNLATFPAFAFLQTDYPLANLYIWPVPDAQYTIFLSFLTPLQQFGSVDDSIVLPPAYKTAILWNLAVELCPMYGIDPSSVLVAKAKTSLNALKLQNNQIPTLRMPAAIANSTGVYNIFGDTYVGKGN